MRCVAVCALASSLAFAAVGCGSAGKPATGVEITAYTGAGDFDMGDGQHVSCAPGRPYPRAVTWQNRSKNTVILTTARPKLDRAPRVLTLVATQLRLEPRPHGMSSDGGWIYGWRWSADRARPLRVPAGRTAIVQWNFRMARCKELAGGRTRVVPGELFLTYRRGDRVGSRTIPELDSRIFLTQGPTKQSCARVLGGSSRVVSGSMTCGVARKAAVACHRVSSDGGTCTSNGEVWDCVAGGPDPRWQFGESCWRPRNKAQWFAVNWTRAA